MLKIVYLAFKTICECPKVIYKLLFSQRKVDFFNAWCINSSYVAVVAQLVERQVVVLDVAGSNPVDRPN